MAYWGSNRHPDDCLIGFFGRSASPPREIVFVRAERLHTCVVGRYGSVIYWSDGRTGKGWPFQDRCYLAVASKQYATYPARAPGDEFESAHYV